MSSMENNPLMYSRVVIAYDATKDRNEKEIKTILGKVKEHGHILQEGDTLTFLGILHRVPHPMGYQMQASPISFIGTKVGPVKEEVSKKVDMHVNMLIQSAKEFENLKVDIEVKITAGTPIKTVVLQEVTSYNASWVILDRHLRKDLRFYLRQIPSKVALIQDDLSVEVLKHYLSPDIDTVEHTVAFSISKPVPLTATQDNKNPEQSVMDCKSFSGSISSTESSDMLKCNVALSTFRPWEHRSLFDQGSASNQEKAGWNTKGENKYSAISNISHKQHKSSSSKQSSDAPVLCNDCGMKTVLSIKDFMRFSFSEIQLATNDFSRENLLGEGGFGLVYKGQLKDGQLIAAKVRKEVSAQGFTEFHSEVFVLSFARHKNIVMLLGYCCKENVNILVYEYICHKSLEWHLFHKTANVLEWRQRHAIAIGTAKGLRYLHEECRGSPIIHRDLRPSNILLTHDLVPMLCDFGLAKWKTNDDPIQTRILGTFGYLAPEYVETGIVSAMTDVYSFGIILIQLISGRKVLDSNGEDQQPSLRQWAEPLIERLALHELIDPRVRDSYDPFESYHMARTAYLCVQSDPEARPSMGVVVHLLEGDNDQYQSLVEQFVPHLSK
ncbi:Non-specific serine/threonine protein kinase [Bertholletia excelsa]